MNVDRLIGTLKRHEGFRSKPYRDTADVLTIGYGRNLDAVGISEIEAHDLLTADVQVALQGARRTVPQFEQIGPVRQEALVNMVFNLGLPRFRGFKRMLAAIAVDDWDRAADEALDSKWARQVGARAREIAAMLRTNAALEVVG